MCSGAMVWTRLGRLVYGASNRQLESILGQEGSDCSAIVFSNSPHRPEVSAGVLQDACLRVLKDYFGPRAL